MLSPVEQQDIACDLLEADCPLPEKASMFVHRCSVVHGCHNVYWVWGRNDTMDYATVIGEVQNRADLPSREDALTVTRAMLETLGERLESGEATNLGAQLPEEIGRHLDQASTDRFSWDEFIDRFMDRGDYDPQDERGTAVHHARVVMAVVDEAISEGEMTDVRDQLPDEYDELFVAADREEQAVTEEQKAEDAD